MRMISVSAALIAISTPVFAQCAAPVRIAAADAVTSQLSGGMVASSQKTGQRNFIDVAASNVALIENGGCYRSDSVFSGRVGPFQGTVFINNIVETLDPSTRKSHDLTFLQIRLSPKIEQTGSFKVSVARSGPDRQCSWYRGVAVQDHYRPGEVVDTAVGTPKNWNDAHDVGTSIVSADRLTRGQFHGSASPSGPSTWDQSNRERFRFSESLTDEFDVVVSIRLICFAGAQDDIAGMLPFDVTSGKSGVIVSYFSSSSSISGSARFCNEESCSKIMNLKIGSPYYGLWAYLLSRR